MAKATAPRSSDAPRDAIELLKQDHRAVEKLFKEFEAAESDEQDDIAQRVCQMLTVHATIEEEILYPAAKEAFDEEDDDMVYEAEVEHGSAKELIAKIEAMTSADESFEATVKVLSEYIKHHVKEEEGEMFPALKKADLDLKEIGSQLMERKLELMDELGLDAAEDEDAQGDRKPAKRASPTQKSKSGARRGSDSTRRSSSRSAR